MARGLLFGLLFAWAETLVVFTLARMQMEMTWSPLNPTTGRLAAEAVFFSTVLGGILGLLGGQRLRTQSRLFVHIQGACFVVIAVLVSPKIDQIFALTFMSIGVTHLVAYLTARFWESRPVAAGLGLLVLALAWYPALILPQPAPPRVVPAQERAKADPSKPNVLWIVMDTTRADHLSLYGYSRPTSPQLDRFAQDALVFDEAYSTAPWTLASHAAMFTGLYSYQHGATHSHLYLDEKHQTIAETLARAGYDTAMFAGNPWFGDHTALNRGFDHLTPAWRNYSLGILFLMGRFETTVHEADRDKGARENNEGFQAWLETRSPDRPFFAFFNYLDPHAPYHEIPRPDKDLFLPEGVHSKDVDEVSFKYSHRMIHANDYHATPEDKELAIASYDAAIAYTDRRIGEMLAQLERRGLLENTLVILNADHGELFGEHDIYGHDLAVYHPLLHVPLIIRPPGGIPGGMRISSPVQLIDLFPTILEQLDLKELLPPGLPGQSLADLLKPVPQVGMTVDPSAPQQQAGMTVDPSAPQQQVGMTVDPSAPQPQITPVTHAPDRPIFAEYYPSHSRPLVMEIKKMGLDPTKFYLSTVQIERQRLIRGPEGREQYFDLEADPEELRPLDSSWSGADRLKSQLDAFPGGGK